MLTTAEWEVLCKGIYDNDYNSGDPTIPVAQDTVEECVDIDSKKVYSIISQLAKKGLVSVDTFYVWLTPKGRKLCEEQGGLS